MAGVLYCKYREADPLVGAPPVELTIFSEEKWRIRGLQVCANVIALERWAVFQMGKKRGCSVAREQ